MTASAPESEGGKRELPPSKRIADDLRRATDAGELAPGSRLPSERELARSYGTARNTARQAIQILLGEGLVEAQHGRGVFVRPRGRWCVWGMTATRGATARWGSPRSARKPSGKASLHG
ncbi:MAG: winged helix-turn-helix domain-containing protein [Egibacteraceae bacterium]